MADTLSAAGSLCYRAIATARCRDGPSQRNREEALGAWGRHEAGYGACGLSSGSKAQSLALISRHRVEVGSLGAGLKPVW